MIDTAFPEIVQNIANGETNKMSKPVKNGAGDGARTKTGAEIVKMWRLSR